MSTAEKVSLLVLGVGFLVLGIVRLAGGPEVVFWVWLIFGAGLLGLAIGVYRRRRR